MKYAIAPWRRKRDSDGTAWMDNPIEQLHRQMDEIFGGVLNAMGPGLSLSDDDSVGLLTPRVDIAESDDRITITADMPGIEEKDVEVSLEKDTLNLRGKRERQSEEKNASYHMIERSCGEFFRAIPLPAGIDPDGIQAKFKNGVLQVTVPKTRDSGERERKIAVTSG